MVNPRIDSKLYRKLTSYLACALAEGFCEGEGASQKKQLTAWQYIYDKRLYLSLQGWYGRRLRDLIQAGLIET